MTFDLEAARAKRRETAKEPFWFTVDGEKYSLPPQTEWPIAVGDLLAQGKVREAFMGLLDRPPPDDFTLGDVNDVMEACAEFFGLSSLPNS